MYISTLALKTCNFFQQTSRLEKYNFSQGTIFLYQGKPQPNEDSLHLTSSKCFNTQTALIKSPTTQQSTKNTHVKLPNAYKSNNKAPLSKEIHNCSLVPFQSTAMSHMGSLNTT